MKASKVRAINSKVNAYIVDCIYPTDYEKSIKTRPAKLKFLAEVFVKEYCFDDNIRRYGFYERIMAEWIMGLPSAFNVDFENYKILELGKEFGILNEHPTEEQEDVFVNNWFNAIARQTIALMRHHDINLEKLRTKYHVKKNKAN